MENWAKGSTVKFVYFSLSILAFKTIGSIYEGDQLYDSTLNDH